MKRIYLASPYSGTDQEQEERFHAVCRVAGKLINEGHVVYSPIAHSHPIAQAFPDIGFDWKAWKRINTTFLEWADEVWVLMIDGWEESKGIKAEMEIAKEARKPVVLIIPQPRKEVT